MFSSKSVIVTEVKSSTLTKTDNSNPYFQNRSFGIVFGIEIAKRYKNYCLKQKTVAKETKIYKSVRFAKKLPILEQFGGSESTPKVTLYPQRSSIYRRNKT